MSTIDYNFRWIFKMTTFVNLCQRILYRTIVYSVAHYDFSTLTIPKHVCLIFRNIDVSKRKGIRGIHTLRMPEDRTMPCSCVELCDKNLEPFRSL